MDRDIPAELQEVVRNFSIEISIVMRQRTILVEHQEKFWTFEILWWRYIFEAQGYWRGSGTVVTLISTTGKTEDIINSLRKQISSAQYKLKQQESFVKINGNTFIGNLLLLLRLKISNNGNSWMIVT